MPVPTFTKLGPSPEFNDLVKKINTLVSELQNLMLGVDSINVFEVGGWRVTLDQLASSDGDVGMSTTDTAGDDIRFWAGDAKTGTPKFKVTKSGILSATDGIFDGKITADEGQIGGFTITATALTAVTGGTIQNKSASGDKVYLNDTGFHANDAAGVERLTIGTTPAQGAKALIGRDSSGTAQSVYTYDTETVDSASRTGQFITAHGAYILIDNSGDIRIQAADGRGFRAVSGTPEINDGFGWTTIAKAGVATSSHVQPNHNHGIPDGTVLMVDGGGTVTFSASGGFTHSHTQN